MGASGDNGERILDTRALTKTEEANRSITQAVKAPKATSQRAARKVTDPSAPDEPLIRTIVAELDRFRDWPEQEARTRLSEAAGQLLVILINTETMREEVGAADPSGNRESQFDVLVTHSNLVTDLLEQAGKGPQIDRERLFSAQMGVHIAGVAYDLMRADWTADKMGISYVARRGANKGLAWTWEGMRKLEADTAWPVDDPNDVQRVLESAMFHRDMVLSLAKTTSVMKTGVMAASIVSGAAGLTQAFVGGVSGLARVANWMDDLAIRSGTLQLSTGAAVPVFRVASSAGSLKLTIAEVVALAETGRVSAVALNLYAMARSGSGRQNVPKIKRTFPEKRVDRTFDKKSEQWFGRKVDKSTHLDKWREVLVRATKSKQIFNWDSRGTPTIAHLARIEGKWFVVQFFRSGDRAGQLATAFVPNQKELTAMLRVIGK